MLGIVAGGTQYMDPTVRAPRAFFDQVDLDSGEVRRITIGFLGHGFTQDPKAPRRAAVFEKKGPGGAIVDLDALVVTEPILPSPDSTFYGHGLFSIDGATVFVVEATKGSLAGKITIRDAASLAVIGEVPTFGTAPHDCLLIDEGKTLVVTNGGGNLESNDGPSITFVDLQQGKLLDKLEPTNARINAGHVARASNGSIVLVSAPRAGMPEDTTTGGISLSPSGEPLRTVQEPADVMGRLFGESLSVCIHEPSEIALVTSPKGNLVTFWHVPERRLVKTWEVRSPRGVTLSKDGAWFVVSCGLKAEVVLVSTSTLEPDPRSYGTALLSGSHAYLRA